MNTNKPIKRSHGTAKEFSAIPAPVLRAVLKLGGDLALARRRRRFSQASMALRIGVSLSTLRRMEKGDLRVPLGMWARGLHLLGELNRLAGLLDTATDEIGLALMDQQLPKRIRARKTTPTSGAL